MCCGLPAFARSPAWLKVLLCRECWAEEPGNRPTFDDIVPRLNDMLKRMNHVSSGASQDKQRSGSQRMDEGEESGSPIKRWGTAPVF